MSTWDLVCTLACSGFPSKEARTCPEVAMVCPAGPVVYASRGPGGQGKPRTHQFCRVETDELKGSQITRSQCMLTCLPEIACSYSLEQNSRISIWRFLKIHWGFSEKGLLLKKTTKQHHQASVLLKCWVGGWLLSVREWIWLPEQPWWLDHSEQLPQVHDKPPQNNNSNYFLEHTIVYSLFPLLVQ